MMSYFLIILDILGAALIAWNLWCIHCIRKSGRERLNILDWVYHGRHSGRDLTAAVHAFNAVTFDDHIKARKFFRDPMALYSFPKSTHACADCQMLIEDKPENGARIILIDEKYCRDCDWRHRFESAPS